MRTVSLVSAKGSLAVDVCIISEDNFDLISKFQVKTMSKCELLDDNDFAPLHSVLIWSSGVVENCFNDSDGVSNSNKGVSKYLLMHPAAHLRGLRGWHGPGKTRRCI